MNATVAPSGDHRGELSSGAGSGAVAPRTAAVTVFFTTSRAELAARFDALKETLAPLDGIWVAWPKKASRIETDLDFGAVQQIGLDAGLVDNKICAIDDDWQAVRFVYRVADREQ